MDDDDRDFEHSPLSGTFSRDGESVDVEIYRYADTQDPWQLVVIDLSSGGCTAWQATFATDQDAYDAFTATVEADGLAPFVGRRPKTLNDPRGARESPPRRTGRAEHRDLSS